MRPGLPIEDAVGKPEGVLITRLHGSNGASGNVFQCGSGREFFEIHSSPQ